MARKEKIAVSAHRYLEFVQEEERTFMNGRVLFLLAAFAFSGAHAGGIETLEPMKGAMVAILTDAQKAFFDMPSERRRELFTNEVFRTEYMGYPAEHVCGERRPRRPCYPKAVRFAWKAVDGVAEYLVTVKDARSGKVVAEETVSGNSFIGTAVYIDNFEAGAEYAWTVSGGGKTGSGKFSTEDKVPRIVRFPDMGNIRDLGGWVGLGGRRVKQGMIFRSAGMNANASPDKAPGESWVAGEKGEYIRRRFGIKTDMDIRSDEECRGMTGSPLGPDVKWVHCPFRMYGGMQDERGRKAFAEVFRVFLDEKNYPIDFHCISGSDRTGSLAYILCGLLGADDNLLALDWELSGFWARSVGFCHEKRYDLLVEGFKKNHPAPTARERIEKYVLSLGFTQADIEKFRGIMLER